MNKLLCVFLLSSVLAAPAFGQAFTGPASIVQPTTANHCLKVQTTGGSTIVDSGANCGSGSGTITSITAGTGLTGGTITSSGTIALALPQAAVIGGVFSKAAVTHDFLTSISSVDGSVGQSQPACADISDAGSGCSGAASAVGANPSQAITGAVHNGSASTFMRSDAAPALGTITQLTTVNLNAAAPPTAISGAAVQAFGADATIGRVMAGSYGAIATVTVARADGTGASPTQVLSGEQIGGINSYAYGSGAWQGAITSLRSYAAENIDSTHYGSKMCLATVVIAGTSMVDGLCQLNTGGVTIATPTSGDALVVTGTTTHNGNVTIAGASLVMSGNISGSGIYGTVGIRHKSVAATFLDTTSSGTVATNYTNFWGGNTLTAANATTITNQFSGYFAAGTAGSGVTLTNNYALGADSLSVGTSNPFTVNAAGAVGVGNTLTVTGLSLGAGSTTSFAKITGTWNDSGTTFPGALLVNVTNTASNVGSKLIDAQTGGGSQFYVSSTGGAWFNGGGTFGSSVTTAGVFRLTTNGGALTFGSSNDLLLTRPAAATLQLGAADADLNSSIVAQTLRVQGALTGGTADQAGKDWNIYASPGKGTGIGGNIIFNGYPHSTTGNTVNAAAAILTLNGDTKAVTFAGPIYSGANQGVSCAANTVTLLTQVVTNGLTTHC